MRQFLRRTLMLSFSSAGKIPHSCVCIHLDEVISLWLENPHHLFTNLSLSILRFFEDLERRHYDNPVIRDISDIVQNHATHHFEPYIVYCSNETFQQRTLQKLL